MSLPVQAGPWSGPAAARRITEETIFDYMDGAGELYLAYRFSHLDVYEYVARDAALGTIRVELYWMKSADDAYGLLSTDWGGEAVGLREGQGSGERDALYGGGLLRFRSGGLYGRVMASRESPASREQVVAIARAIVQGRPENAPPPGIVSSLPPRLGDRLALRPDRTCFFRSHLVLNSVHYLAPDDVLNLGPDVEAAVGEYRATGGGPAVRLVQIVYPSPASAESGLRRFARAHVSAPAGEAAGAPGPAAASAEGGWAGWAAKGRALSIVLGAPGEPEAKAWAAAALAAVAER